VRTRSHARRFVLRLAPMPLTALLLPHSAVVPVFNISDPGNPTFVRNIDVTGHGGGGKVHDITAIGGRLYICEPPSAGYIHIYDISDVANKIRRNMTAGQRTCGVAAMDPRYVGVHRFRVTHQGCDRHHYRPRLVHPPPGRCGTPPPFPASAWAEKIVLAFSPVQMRENRTPGR